MAARFKSQWSLATSKNPLMRQWAASTTKAVQESIQVVGDYLASQMESQKHGREYTRDHITWIASADYEYPAIFKGNLIADVRNPHNMKVVWDGWKCSCWIECRPFVEAYAIDILEAGLRPWRNRAMMACAPQMEMILGPKLLMEVENGLGEVTSEKRSRNR